MSSRDHECAFAAFVIQHAMHMRHSVICGLSDYTNNIFHIISYTARFLRKKVINIKCVFLFSVQLLSEIFLILRRIKRDMIENVNWSSREDSVILVPFQ
jgi:hypothetical protein